MRGRLCACSNGLPTEKPEKSPKLVLAFYYPWYSLPWGPTPDDPINGPYDSTENSLITWHFELAENAGIDGFIVSWWGQGHPTDKAFRQMLDVAERINTPVKLTIYYEKVPLDGKAGVISELRAILDDCGGRKTFLRVEGRPVIFIYGRAVGGLSASGWAEVFENLRGDGYDAIFVGDWLFGFGSPFDGLHMYNPIGSSLTHLSPKGLKDWLTRFYYPFMRDNRIFGATVVPGYDDTLVPGGMDLSIRAMVGKPTMRCGKPRSNPKRTGF